MKHLPYDFTRSAFEKFATTEDVDKWLRSCLQGLASWDDPYIMQQEIEHLADLSQAAQIILNHGNHHNVACLLWEKELSKTGHFMLMTRDKNESFCKFYDSYGRLREGEEKREQALVKKGELLFLPTGEPLGVHPVKSSMGQPAKNWIQPNQCKVYQPLASATCGAWAIYFFISCFEKSARISGLQPLNYSGVEADLKRLASLPVNNSKLLSNDWLLFKFMRKHLMMWSPTSVYVNIMHPNDINHSNQIYKDDDEGE
jgi:hypothetical protein